MGAGAAKTFVITVAASVLAALVVGYLTTNVRSLRRLIGG